MTYRDYAPCAPAIRRAGRRAIKPAFRGGWSIPAAYRFKSQPHRERSCNLQIAIELQRSAGRVAPFRMAKIDFDVITDIAAKCKIDGKPRVLHADIDAGENFSLRADTVRAI